LNFPSWQEFTIGLREFEENINSRISDTSYIIKNFFDRHSTVEKIFNASLTFLPSPFNEIAKAIYGTFQVSGEDKAIQEVLSSLKSIEDQGEIKYNQLTSKLDIVLKNVMKINNTGAKQKNLLEIQEILTSQFDTTNEKIDQIRKQLVELRNIVENGLIKFGKGLSKLDEGNYPELIATISNEPVNTQFKPSVVAQIEDGQVVFRSTRFKDQELNRITINDLKSVMDPGQLLIFEAYTSSLNKNLEEWADIKRKGKLDTDPEMRDIAKRICSNWSEIMELLGTISYKILDHYGHLWMVCRNSGMIIDKTKSDL
jgi:hypothetical protein